MASNETDIQARANESYELLFDDEQKQLIAKAAEGDTQAEQELSEQVLALSLKTTNHQNETRTWVIDLGTGGPAYRIKVKTDFNGEVIDADYQFQDWFEPWTSATNQDKELVIDFVSALGLIFEV